MLPVTSGNSENISVIKGLALHIFPFNLLALFIHVLCFSSFLPSYFYALLIFFFFWPAVLSHHTSWISFLIRCCFFSLFQYTLPALSEPVCQRDNRLFVCLFQIQKPAFLWTVGRGAERRAGFKVFMTSKCCILSTPCVQCVAVLQSSWKMVEDTSRIRCH